MLQDGAVPSPMSQCQKLMRNPQQASLQTLKEESLEPMGKNELLPKIAERLISNLVRTPVPVPGKAERLNQEHHHHHQRR